MSFVPPMLCLPENPHLNRKHDPKTWQKKGKGQVLVLLTLSNTNHSFLCSTQLLSFCEIDISKIVVSYSFILLLNFTRLVLFKRHISLMLFSCELISWPALDVFLLNFVVVPYQRSLYSEGMNDHHHHYVKCCIMNSKPLFPNCLPTGSNIR